VDFAFAPHFGAYGRISSFQIRRARRAISVCRFDLFGRLAILAPSFTMVLMGYEREQRAPVLERLKTIWPAFLREKYLAQSTPD
jgi:hypothetical protein